MLILWFVVGHLWAVGEAGAIFLLIAPGAGPAGTGEAQVAKANDAYASYYNPAGLGFLQGKEVTGMHVNWLPNLASDLYYEFITYRHYIDGLGSIGGHIIYLNLGEQIGMDEFGIVLVSAVILIGKTVELLLVFGTNCIPTTTKAITNAVITVAYTGVKPKYVLPTVLATYCLAEGRFFSNSTRFISFAVNSSEVFTSGSFFMDFINERIDSN